MLYFTTTMQKKNTIAGPNGQVMVFFTGWAAAMRRRQMRMGIRM
jgi:hypothetical protein